MKKPTIYEFILLGLIVAYFLPWVEVNNLHRSAFGIIDSWITYQSKGECNSVIDFLFYDVPPGRNSFPYWLKLLIAIPYLSLVIIGINFYRHYFLNKLTRYLSGVHLFVICPLLTFLYAIIMKAIENKNTDIHIEFSFGFWLFIILSLFSFYFYRKQLKAYKLNSPRAIRTTQQENVTQVHQEANSEPIEVKPKQEIKTETKFSSDRVQPISFAKEKSGTSLSKFILIAVGVVLLASSVYYIKNKSSDETKQANEQSISNENERLQAIISQVNELVSQKNYDEALLQINNINWIYEPGSHNDYVEQYNSQRENLKQTITELKLEKVASEKSIATINATESSDSLEQLIKETMSENNYSFPYAATAIVYEAHFYKSQDVNSMRNAYIIKGQAIQVDKEEGEFIYAEFDNNGKVTEGWMLKSDFEKK